MDEGVATCPGLTTDDNVEIFITEAYKNGWENKMPIVHPVVKTSTIEQY